MTESKEGDEEKTIIQPQPLLFGCLKESILPSAQIDKLFYFHDKNIENPKTLTSQAIMVGFSSLLFHNRPQSAQSQTSSSSSCYNRPQSSNSNNLDTPEQLKDVRSNQEQIISSISNEDLFHAVVGLYDACLPDMTLNAISECVQTKQAKTIILLRDLEETLNEIETKRIQSSSNQNCDSEDCKFTKELSRSYGSTETLTENVDSQRANKKKTHISTQGQSGDRMPEKNVENLEESDSEFFANFFNESDEETKEEEEEETEESEEFSSGIHAFKKSICHRKHLQQKHKHFHPQDVGVEDRIIACATFTKVLVESKDRIIQLTFIAVKKKWRNMGIGKYIISKLAQPSVVGCYDAIVVHADYSALGFFKHLGFSDDYILNSRWSSICSQFTDCVLMTFIPAFTVSGIPISSECDKEFTEMEEEFSLWKLKSLSAYQTQLTCLHRMKNEVFHLKSMVDLQHQLILKLVRENEQLSLYNESVMSLKQKHSNLSKESANSSESQEKKSIFSRHECPDGNVLTTLGNSTFITYRPQKMKKSNPPDYVHVVNSLTDVIQKFKIDFEHDARRINMHVTCAITAILKASNLSPRVQTIGTDIEEKKRKSRACSPYSPRSFPHSKERMYFCSHQSTTTEKLQEILECGFTNEHFSSGDLGEGLHFCRSPFIGAHFSVPGKLLLADVQLGKIKCDFKMPSVEERSEWGSLLTSAPLNITLANGRSSQNLLEEYLVLKTEQATPLCLIEYETSKSVIDFKSYK